MTTTTRRLVALLVMLLAVAGLPAPQALAAPVTTPAQITINNNAVNGTALAGGQYTATLVATVDPATGVQTAVEGGTTTVIPEGTTTTLPQQYAVYSVVQTTRTPGYLLDSTAFTVEFPQMSGGVPTAEQNLVVNRKLTPVLGTATLTKYANGGTTPLPGATFSLFRTADANGPLDAPQEVTTGLVTSDAGTVTAADLTEGSYYFVETAAPAGYAVDTQTRYAFTVGVDANGTAVVTSNPGTAQNYTEPSQSTVTKQVDELASTTGNVGQTMNFTITVQVPQDIREYPSYVVTDTLDDRYAPGAPTTTNGTVTVQGQVVTATLDPATAPAGGTVTITIPATIRTTAAGGDVIPNTASVAWDNGQGDTGTFSTLSAPVTVTEGSLVVTKRDGSTQAALAGATFILTDAQGNQLNDINGDPYSATSGTDGTLTFSRLPMGTYYLRETVAPSGYRLRDQADTITITTNTPNATAEVDNYLLSQTGLPNTGGWAAVPYYLAGLLLVGLFLVLWRRRRDDEDQSPAA